METFVTKKLNSLGIKYKPFVYPKEIFTAGGVAKEQKIRLGQVVKTMVVKVSDGNFVLALLAGDQKLDFKRLSEKQKGRKVELAKPEEVKEVTSLKVGAISPLIALEKNLKVYLDQELAKESLINISSGNLKMGININMQDLIKILEPEICDISK